MVERPVVQKTAEYMPSRIEAKLSEEVCQAGGNSVLLEPANRLDVVRARVIDLNCAAWNEDGPYDVKRQQDDERALP